MKTDEPCPLTPCLLTLLQTCVELSTTADTPLCNRLNVSPHTVRTEFKRIFVLVNAHFRSESVLLALKRGWVTLPVEQSDTKG
jgi:hypothetical protein